MRHFLVKTRLWILALPLLISFLGAGLNQLVFAANHDKFPVMLNESKRAALAPDQNGMFGPDLVHCVMTKDTHLNFLADYLDFRSEIDSPGDMLLSLGDYLLPLAIPFWVALIVMDLTRLKSEPQWTATKY